MTLREILTKWRHIERKERSSSSNHRSVPCALLGVVDPVAADPAGEWFTFGKGVGTTSGGDR